MIFLTAHSEQEAELVEAFVSKNVFACWRGTFVSAKVPKTILPEAFADATHRYLALLNKQGTSRKLAALKHARLYRPCLSAMLSNRTARAVN